MKIYLRTLWICMKGRLTLTPARRKYKLPVLVPDYTTGSWIGVLLGGLFLAGIPFIGMVIYCIATLTFEWQGLLATLTFFLVGALFWTVMGTLNLHDTYYYIDKNKVVNAFDFNMWKLKVWQAPINEYTGFQIAYVKTTSSKGGSSKYHVLELTHPDHNKCIPLYQTFPSSWERVAKKKKADALAVQKKWSGCLGINPQ